MRRTFPDNSIHVQELAYKIILQSVNLSVAVLLSPREHLSQQVSCLFTGFVGNVAAGSRG